MSKNGRCPELATAKYFRPLIVAVVLSRQGWQAAAPLAYIAGGLGSLIGTAITNHDKARALSAPVASIFGAGTFDGIFLAGILAVLLVSFYAPRKKNEA